MPEPVIVWKVNLEPGASRADVRGRLAADDPFFVFTEDGSERATRIPAKDIRQVKRLRLSSVLLVTWSDTASERRTAFYFSKPPPISTLGGEETPAPATLRTPRPMSPRREKRRNAAYLTHNAVPLRPIVAEWVAEMREAMGRAGG